MGKLRASGGKLRATGGKLRAGKLRTGKLRYSGDTGKYGSMTGKELKELLKKHNVPGRSKLKTRFAMIKFLEQNF